MENTAIRSKRYNALDGLRAFAIIGIVLMHVRANGGYQVGGFVFNQMIPAFTNLVFLFMMISGFGMCYGYFEKIVERKITVEEFYNKRYVKIWPFFALLCILDLVMSPSVHSVYEVFANLTLCQGLLPNAKIEVIGVGWTLGVIFVFYLLFPFFCYLLSNHRRAWLTFAVALIYNILCTVYFFDGNHMPEGFSARTSFIYCAVFFVTGGLIYLYRDKLEIFAMKYRLLALLLCMIATVAYFVAGAYAGMILLLSSVLLIYALGINREGILINPVTKFIGGISFEIYLCHMVIYRVLEKFHLNHLLANDLVAYIVASIGTIAGAIMFSVCIKWIMNKANGLKAFNK